MYSLGCFNTRDSPASIACTGGVLRSSFPTCIEHKGGSQREGHREESQREESQREKSQREKSEGGSQRGSQREESQREDHRGRNHRGRLCKEQIGIGETENTEEVKGIPWWLMVRICGKQAGRGQGGGMWERAANLNERVVEFS